MAQTTQTVQIPVPVVTPSLNENSGTVATVFFIADRAYTVSSLNWLYAVKGSNATCTFDVFKDTGTNAPGAGTSILLSAAALDVGTNTAIVANTLTANTLNATAGVTTLAAGNRLSWKLTGTLTALVGLEAVLVLSPV